MTNDEFELQPRSGNVPKIKVGHSGMCFYKYFFENKDLCVETI